MMAKITDKMEDDDHRAEGSLKGNSGRNGGSCGHPVLTKGIQKQEKGCL